MRNFIKNTVYMFMIMMFAIGVNLVFELKTDGVNALMTESLYTRVLVILFISMILSLYMLLFDYQDARHKIKILKNLNDFDNGEITMTKDLHLTGSYIDFYRIYNNGNGGTYMYYLLTECITYTRLRLKDISLIKDSKLKFRHIKVLNNLKSMLSILVEYETIEYRSWVETKEVKN